MLKIWLLKDPSNGSLTTGVDTGAAFVGGAGDDVFNAADVAAGATWTALDALVGGDGDDTLNITAAAAIANPAGSTVSGIETANVTSNDKIDLDTTKWAGLTSLSTTAETAAKTTDVTAAATTNVTAVAAGDTTITGGLDVTATVTKADLTVDGAAGAIDATVAGGDLTVVDAVAAVDVTVTAQAAKNIVIDGGTSVNVTATGVTTGTIGIGSTTEPTGAVVVTSTGASTGANAQLGNIDVVGGSTVTVTQGVAFTATQVKAALGKGATNSTVAQSDVTVTGTASTTAVTVSQQAEVALVVGTGTKGNDGVDVGAVTITDATGAKATDPDTIATVTLANYGATTVESSALSTLSLTGGAVASGALTLDTQSTGKGATTLALNLNGGTFGAVSGTQAAKYTTVNIATDGVSETGTLTFSAATAVTISGDGDLETSGQAFAAKAVITNGSTGDVTLGSDIAAGQKYVGGAGVDTVSFAVTNTTASTLGAGDDVARLAGVAGTGGSVDGGEGDDTVLLTAALAVSLTANSDFEDSFANFEKLSVDAVAATAANGTIALANLDTINSVTLAGATAHTGAGATTTISGFASGGTFAQTALLGSKQDVTLTGAFTGKSDTFNLSATGTDGYANVGVLTLASVETVNITTSATGTISAMFDLNLTAAAATKVNLSGNTGVDFTNSSLAALTTLDASGVTGEDADGAVTFTANTAIDTTIIGGAGDDVLTGSTGVDTITGGAGGDTLDGDAGNDTITGGDGDDTITGGAGEDTLTGGAGEDVFVFAAGDSTTADPDVITDFSAEDDVIQHAGVTVGVATASVTAGTGAGVNVEVDADGKVTFAASDDTLAEKLIALAADTTDVANGEAVFFEDSGNTYIFIQGAAADELIQLTGVTGFDTLDLTGANLSFA